MFNVNVYSWSKFNRELFIIWYTIFRRLYRNFHITFVNRMIVLFIKGMFIEYVKLSPWSTVLVLVRFSSSPFFRCSIHRCSVGTCLELKCFRMSLYPVFWTHNGENFICFTSLQINSVKTLQCRWFAKTFPAKFFIWSICTIPIAIRERLFWLSGCSTFNINSIYFVTNYFVTHFKPFIEFVNFCSYVCIFKQSTSCSLWTFSINKWKLFYVHFGCSQLWHGTCGRTVIIIGTFLLTKQLTSL